MSGGGFVPFAADAPRGWSEVKTAPKAPNASARRDKKTGAMRPARTEELTINSPTFLGMPELWSLEAGPAAQAAGSAMPPTTWLKPPST
jgi:hypothetical protein